MVKPSIGAFVGKSKKSKAAAEEAAAEQNHTGQYANVSKHSLKPDPHQPRKEFVEEEIESLAASIRSIGITQPLVVHETNDDEHPYQIIVGERRWRASMRVENLIELPVMIRNDLAGLDKEVAKLIVQITENHQRAAMNPLELAVSCRKVVNASGSHEDAAKALGMSPSGLSIALKSENLHPEIAQLAENGLVRDRNTLSSMSDLMAIAPETAQELVERVNSGEPIAGGVRKATTELLRETKKKRAAPQVAAVEESAENANLGLQGAGLAGMGDTFPADNPGSVDENQIDWVNSDREIWSGITLNIPIEFLDALFKKLRLTDIQKGHALRLINEKNDQLGLDENLTALGDLFVLKK